MSPIRTMEVRQSPRRLLTAKVIRMFFHPSGSMLRLSHCLMLPRMPCWWSIEQGRLLSPMCKRRSSSVALLRS